MTELLFSEVEVVGCTPRQRAIIDHAWSKARIKGDKSGTSGKNSSSYTYIVREGNLILRSNHFTNFSGSEQVVIEISKGHAVLFRAHVFTSGTIKKHVVDVKKDQATSEVLKFLEMQ